MNEALKSLKTVPNSKIIFFKNGECQGEAFIDIHHGAYYPAISIYKNATVSINFGPNFKYPEVEEEYKCKGVLQLFQIFSLIKFRASINIIFFLHLSNRCTTVSKN